MDTVLPNMLLSLIFALLGFVLLFLGFKVFDWLTPTDLAKSVFHDGNVAAAILAGAFIVALAMVVAASIS